MFFLLNWNGTAYMIILLKNGLQTFDWKYGLQTFKFKGLQ